MTWGKRRAIVICIVILFFVALIWVASKPAHIASKSVLVLDVSGTIDEQRSADIFSALSGESTPVLHDYLDAIDAAYNDHHITGIIVRIGPLSTGWGKLEEIRNHIVAFRRSGKPSICYLGYDGIGNPEYYVASACSQVWLLPTAPMGIHGMMAEALFMRGTLDKLKIVPQFFHIAEYKTATNMFTEKKFTPAHKDEVQTLLYGIYNEYLTDTSQARGIERSKFESLVNQGPLSTDDALAGGLVDRKAYWDQVQTFFKMRDGGWHPISLNRYRAFLHPDGGDEIAIVHATGLIVSGESENTAGGGFIMGGDSVAADIRRARNDSDIKAIVLRIDSGGGSAVASEVIRREVELAKARKPVVVSMSDVAASGGYWIAMSANKIVADPNTITASIGVLIGKFNVSGLYNLLGLSTDYVATSDNATMFSEQQNFTPAQQAAIQKSLQETYANFTKGVAEGRHMSVEAVDKIGKGRVWTGAQAQKLGLVDELGGIDAAVRAAKQLANIPENQSVHLLRFPVEKSFFQQLLERERDQQIWATQSLDDTLRRIAGVMDPVQARMPFELHIK
ncbi:MAG: signal peptide peptidase SppA [Candidatus Acidiferrales bacterium]